VTKQHELTRGEFFSLKKKSRLELIRLDGVLLKTRVMGTGFLLEVFSIYGFKVQVVKEVKTNQLCQVTHVAESYLADLYLN